MTDDERLVDDGAVRLFLAQEELEPSEETITYARRALGIGEQLEHFGDCTKVAVTCRLCMREEYQRMMRAAIAAINASGTAAPREDVR